MGLAGLAMVSTNRPFYVCGLAALTNIAVLTVPTYGIPHAWPVVPLSNHFVSAVHPKMVTRVMELVQHRQHQSLGYEQTSLVGQKLPQTIF